VSSAPVTGIAAPLGESCGLRCRIAALVLPALAGALFAAGLLLGGMTLPARVIGFLDVTSASGPWDPTLAFVMGGAVLTYALAFRRVRGQRSSPWFGELFHLPARRDLDPSLVLGAALFGAGWGLGGFCPGPALVSAAAGTSSALVFGAAMLLGMLVQHGVALALARRSRRGGR
jgi:uncharacterized protein